MSNSRYFIIPEIESEENPDLQDFLVVMPGQADDPNARVYRLATIIDQFAGRINRNIPENAVGIDQLDSEVLRFIVYGRLADGTIPQLSGTTPTETDTQSAGPETVAGVPTKLLDGEDTDEILPPSRENFPEIVTLNPRQRTVPPSKISAPVTYLPSQPTQFFLDERDSELWGSWQPPEDNGGTDILNYEVAIEEYAEDINIDDLTWIDVELDLTYVFPNLENNKRYIAFVRDKNKVGYSVPVSISGIPFERVIENLTVTLSSSANTFTNYANDTNQLGFIPISAVFSDVPQDFVQADITTTNVERITDFRRSGHKVTFNLHPEHRASDVTVSIAAGVATNSDNTQNLESNTLTFTFVENILLIAPQAKNVFVSPGDRNLEVTWEDPLINAHLLTGWKISLDDIEYLPISRNVHVHRFVNLENGQEYPIYLKSTIGLRTSEPFIIYGTPTADSRPINVPSTLLPAPIVPVSSELWGGSHFRFYWDTPERPNYDGFEVRTDPTSTTWERLDKTARHYDYTLQSQIDAPYIEVRSYNEHGHSEPYIMERIPIGLADQITNASIEAGNYHARITFDELGELGAGSLGPNDLPYSNAQWVSVLGIVPTGEDLPSDATGYGPIASGHIVPLNNGVTWDVHIASRTRQFTNDPIILTVSPADTHASDGSVGDPASVAVTSNANGELTITWEEPSDTGGGPGVGQYELRLTNKYLPWIELPANARFSVHLPATARSHTFTGLLSGAQHEIEIRTINFNGTWGSHTGYNEGGFWPHGWESSDGNGLITVPNKYNSDWVAVTGIPT